MCVVVGVGGRAEREGPKSSSSVLGSPQLMPKTKKIKKGGI